MGLAARKRPTGFHLPAPVSAYHKLTITISRPLAALSIGAFMLTASHFTFFGPGRIVISRGIPRNASAGYRIYKALAPSRETLAVETYEDYLPRYMAQLAQLDPQRVWDDLHRLAGSAQPVLLCYERPPLHRGNFCHRRMVADWFKDTLGQDVPEYRPQPKPKDTRQGGLF